MPVHAAPVHWQPRRQGDSLMLCNWIEPLPGLSIEQRERMSFLSTLQIIADFGEAVGNALVCSAIHRRPSAAGLHWPDQYRGIPIQSDCVEDAILIDVKSLALPNPNFHGAGTAEEEGFLEALRDAHPSEQAARFRQQVKGWIRAALPVGNCRLELLAAVDLSELSRASKTRTSSIEFWLILRARNRTPPPCHT